MQMAKTMTRNSCKTAICQSTFLGDTLYFLFFYSISFLRIFVAFWPIFDQFLANFLTDLFWPIRQIFSRFLADFWTDFLGIVIEVNLIFQQIFGRFDQFLAIFLADFLGIIIEVNLICQIHNLLAKSVHFTTCVMKNNIGSLKKKIW